MNVADYIGKLNPILKAFIENICDIDVSVASKKDIYSFAKLIEHFLSLKNSRCLAPLSLYQNVVIYSIAQSKIILELIRRASPSGSYTTYYNWFDKLSYDKLRFPNGLVVAANADNDNDVGIIIENDEMIFETVNFKLNKHSQVNVVFDKNKIETNECELAVKILLGEPILINPNSFENVTEVFRKIGKEAGIKKYNGNLRDCLMIVCDGLPAVLGWNIIFNTFFCKKCQLSFNEVNKIKQHNTEIHRIETEDVFEFNWILLRLAYGHYHINSLKTVIAI